MTRISSFEQLARIIYVSLRTSVHKIGRHQKLSSKINNSDSLLSGILRNNSRYFFLLTLALASVFLFSFNQISESDTGFIIRTGDFILQNHTVPLYDVFSYASENARWIVHYWIPAVLFSFLNSLGGLFAVIFIVAVISFFTFFFLFKTIRLYDNDLLLSILLTPIFFGLTFAMWSARPQIFSYLFSVFLVFLLEYWTIKRSSVVLVILPLFFLLWANCHAGVVLGLFILALFAFQQLIAHRFRFTKEIFIFWSVVFSSFLITFINPNGWKTLFYSKFITSTVHELNIMEWLSILTQMDKWQARIFLTFMIVVTGFLCWRFFETWRREHSINVFHVGLVLFAFALPLDSVRHIIFFPLLVFPIFVRELHIFLSSYQVVDYLYIFLKRLFVVPILLCVFLIFGMASLRTTFRNGLVNHSMLPVGVADFMVAQNIQGPIFNIEHGGYFIFRFWPKEKIFIDGRSEVFTGKPLQEFLTIARHTDGWQSLVNEKYHINAVVLWYKQPLTEIAQNVAVTFIHELNFKLVYWDDTSLLLIRDIPENKNFINTFGYIFANPYRDPSAISLSYVTSALTEINRGLLITPNSSMLRNYGNILYARLHNSESK